MGFGNRLLGRLILCCLFIALVASAAFAAGSHERTQFGHDIIIASGETVSDVSCFGCSVRVRGQVATDVTTFGGSVIVEDGGSIGTDVTAFGGNLRLDKGAKIGHDVTVFGGRIQRDSEASIGGDVTTFSGSFWLVLIFALPFLILAGFIVLIVWLVRQMTRRTVPAAV